MYGWNLIWNQKDSEPDYGRTNWDSYNANMKKHDEELAKAVGNALIKNKAIQDF